MLAERHDKGQLKTESTRVLYVLQSNKYLKPNIRLIFQSLVINFGQNVQKSAQFLNKKGKKDKGWKGVYRNIRKKQIAIEIKRKSYLAEQFRQIKRSLAEQFRQIKCSLAEPQYVVEARAKMSLAIMSKILASGCTNWYYESLKNQL